MHGLYLHVVLLTSRRFIHYFVVFVPPKILHISRGIPVEIEQILGELLRALKVLDIDVRVRWEDLGVIGAAHHNGDDLVHVGIEDLAPPPPGRAREEFRIKGGGEEMNRSLSSKDCAN